MTPFDRLHPAVQHHVVNSLGWNSLRPTQEEAIAPILDGANVLLLAPTAGGKTEAALLPLLSRMHEERWGRPAVLYICPLKALLNNLAPRVERLASFVGRRAAVWHGDIGASQRRRLLADPPDILLTTPESIEAMLLSTRVDHETLFADLRAVVVDELHAFGGDDRGWHLLAILSRLTRLANRPLQRIGLSATVGNPQDLGTWLAEGQKAEVIDPAAGQAAPKGSSDPRVSSEPEVTLDYVASLSNAALVISRLHRGEKRLIFCDSRSKVEELAALLRAHEVETYVSHSSLSQDERRRAEEAFATGQDCVIVATSTLELGLDVGDLDRVVQIDAPATVSSFLQRMGRTGRRAGTRRNCLFLATEPDAFLQACGLLLLWSRAFVERIAPPRSPWHLYSQQVMALVLQERGLLVDAPARLARTYAFADLGRQEAARIMEHLLEAEILHEDGGLLSFGVEGERRFGRRHFMDLVSAFAAEPLFLVRHGRQELGQVHPRSFLTRDGRPAVLLLAGRSWALGEIDWNARVAWVSLSEELGRSRWEGSSRALGAELCRAVRGVLAGGDVEHFLSRRSQLLLEELKREFHWVRAGATRLVYDASRRSRWWTFAGSLANGMLASGLERAGIGVRRHDNHALTLEGEVDAGAFREAVSRLGEPETLRPEITDELLANLKYSEALPLEMGRGILELRHSDLPSALQALGEPLEVLYQ